MGGVGGWGRKCSNTTLCACSRGKKSLITLIYCHYPKTGASSSTATPTAITDADLTPATRRSLLQAGNAVGTINAVLAITSQVVGGVAKVVNAGVGIVSPAANAVSSHIPLLVPAIGGRCPPNSTPTLLPNINRVVFCDLGTAQQAVNVALQTAQGFANAAASLVPSGLPSLPYFPAARARGRRMLTLRFGEAA